MCRHAHTHTPTHAHTHARTHARTHAHTRTHTHTLGFTRMGKQNNYSIETLIELFFIPSLGEQ